MKPRRENEHGATEMYREGTSARGWAWLYLRTPGREVVFMPEGLIPPQWRRAKVPPLCYTTTGHTCVTIEMGRAIEASLSSKT